eukprot:COSAG01_NODE_9_length_43729_cov_66.133463_29_plen_374_part_00
MDISIDSRKIKAGQYFIPVKGKNFNGADFIDDAVKKGGILLDVDLYKYSQQYRRKLKAKVIAISGSVGKSTLKEMLYATLSPYFKTIKTEGNQNNEIGVPLSLLRADYQSEIIILELGIRQAHDMPALVRLCRPHISILTNIHMAHMAFFNSIRQLALAKSRIFQAPLSWEVSPRHAYINRDSAYADLQEKKATQAKYTCHYFQGKQRRDAPINLCYMIGRQFNLSDQQIATGLSRFKPMAQRLKKEQLKRCILYDDSYNASPEGVIYASQQLRLHTGRKIIILGDMLELGDYTKKGYAHILPFLLENDIKLFISYGNIQPNFGDKLFTIHFSERAALHAFLEQEIRQEDIILVKGSRSMKMEETVSFLKQHV